ncbi:hypothetical protein DR864_10700 [Runella rosea]|uniref:Uncharacterized protein n=1 Tax=Runella rosea TaxID=2259595 RepID=A0A344THQ5_9BACT|nr:hypothetical protein [Runella rosea]AXE18176.1 hypothetical protein DR864_10700 [Runella rosea]
MKNVLAPVATVILLATVMVFNSCKNREEDPTVGFSKEIQKIVPQSIVNDLRAKGMTINEGKVPPTLEGAFRANPYELLSPTGPEDVWAKGKIITAYRYLFSQQTADGKEVKIDYKSENGVDVGSGLGAFISGYGNKFTVFAEVKGRHENVDYTNLIVISGEVTPKGIADLQHSLYLTQKSEGPGRGVLIPVNTGRIWIDKDKLAEKISNYRIGVTEKSSDGETHSSVSNQ